MKYYDFDDVTLRSFDENRCPGEWEIRGIPPPCEGFPDGVIESRLYLTRRGHYVESRRIYCEIHEGLPDEYRDNRRITEEQGLAILRKIGASPDPEPLIKPIICSQAELGQQLGFKPKYPHLLEVLKTRNVVAQFKPANPARYDPANPASCRLWKIWLADPAEHRRVLKAIRRLRRRKEVEGK
jgi:hypothetical protein